MNRPIFAAACTLVLCTGQPAISAVAPMLLVAPVQSDLTGASRVGSRQTGLLCLSDGSVLWRDAEPSAASTQAAIAQALRSAAINAAVLADDPSGELSQSKYRLEVKIIAAQVDACVAQHGIVRRIGGRAKTKVSGQLNARWRIIDRRTQEIVWQGERVEALTGQGRDMPISEAVTAGLTAGARSVADQIRSLH